MNPAQILRYCDRQYVSELLTLYRANWFIDTVDEKHSSTVLTKEFLVNDLHWNLRSYDALDQEAPITQNFLTVLRTAKQRKDGTDWHALLQDKRFARSFIELMNC